jgi:hypothetical protein
VEPRGGRRGRGVLTRSAAGRRRGHVGCRAELAVRGNGDHPAGAGLPIPIPGEVFFSFSLSVSFFGAFRFNFHAVFVVVVGEVL